MIDLREYPLLWARHPVTRGHHNRKTWDVSIHTALFLYMSELETMDPVGEFGCYEEVARMLKRESGDDFFRLRWPHNFKGLAGEMVRAEWFRREIQIVDWALRLEDGRIRVEVTT